MSTSNQRRAKRLRRERLRSKVDGSLFSLEEGKLPGTREGVILDTLAMEARHREDCWGVIEDARVIGVTVDDDVIIGVMAQVMPHLTPHGKKKEVNTC